ncbi:MAG: single-stranded-DNA-specific exonuclease RecJ [Candidatus Izimaplasma sp.]|nr:single-stranded-DNA-specific exonuclease RecJ [Candidatus Izimaplasma bacterium]
MIKSKYVWNKQINGIVKDEDVFDLITKNRDILDYKAFFSMGKEHLINPFLLNDMEKAVNRIKKAIDKFEKILIFGDYDCDGITSVAIIYRGLKSLGANVEYKVPDRFKDGYGLNKDIVTEIIEKGYSLIITVDNGINSVSEINELNLAEIDTILTDHHELGEKLPNAYALIHTKVSPKYPFKDIAGCMVAFKLIWALFGRYPEELSDLVMIGTIADLMPLVNENQAIVNLGLKQLKKTQNLGLEKILKYSDLDIINATAISFQIAPKINSSGRLNKANLAIELLITEDLKLANELILEIEENHKLRKKHTKDSFDKAEKLINHSDQVLVLASEELHEGVIGICAQRISEKYQKPTIVLTIENGIAKGSARSFGNLSILNMLDKTSEYLERYGGHSQAAGMQLKADKISDFRQKLNSFPIEESDPVLDIDMEVDLTDISMETINRLQNKSFHTALFLIRDLRVIRKQIIATNHVKLVLELNGHLYEAIKFNNLEYYYNLDVDDIIDICGGLTINRYRNKESIQIMINDIRCNHLQVLDYRNKYNLEVIKDNLFDNFISLNDSYILLDNLDEFKKLMINHKSFVILPKKYNFNYNLIVDRNELGKIYFDLKKVTTFNKTDIIEAYNINEIFAEVIINIFTDLDFIEKVSNNYMIKTAKKTELKESKTYQDFLKKKKMIDWLYQSHKDKIKEYMEGYDGL